MKKLINENKTFFRPLLFTLALSTALSGCGGGGGGGSSSTTPAAATVDPVNGATNVERNAVLTATFTGDVTEASVDAASFTLGDSGGNPVAGAVNAVSDVATFTPDADLGVLRTYTATLATSIQMDSAAITAMNWSFTTRDGVWAAAEEIETDDVNNASEMRIAFDPDGNAIAIWSQNSNVYANYYNASTGMWGTAGLVETTVSGVSHPRIAMTNDGIGVAVWSHNIGGTMHIYSNRYTPGGGWGTEEPIEANTGNAFYPEVAIDGSGNVIVVWEQDNNAVQSIWVNRYINGGGGWNTANAEEIDDTDNPIETGSNPHIAIDDGGDAIAVWAQDNGAGYNAIYAAYYTSGGNWSAPGEIGEDATDGLTPKIATDKDGNYIAVWEQPANGGGTDSIWANRYSGGMWGTAQEIESTGFAASDPQIAFDASGNALSIWIHNGDVRSNTYTFNSGWGTDVEIDSGSLQGAGFPDLAVDEEGHAIAVWRQVSAAMEPNSIWANRYQYGSGWGTAEPLENDTTNATSNQRITIDRKGNAFAAWIQNDGNAETVFVRRFE